MGLSSHDVLPASSQVKETASKKDGGMDPDTDAATDADTGTWALSHVETEADTGRWSLLQPDNPDYNVVAYAYARGNKKSRNGVTTPLGWPFIQGGCALV